MSQTIFILEGAQLSAAALATFRSVELPRSTLGRTPWLADEDAILLDMRKHRATFLECANVLRRSEPACRARYELISADAAWKREPVA